MGQIGFTSLQQYVFDAFSKSPSARNFYFTGGTALSVFYLHHRESVDLDFFTENEFNTDEVIEFVEEVSSKKKLTYEFTQKYKTRIFQFKINEKNLLKVDFNHYPYKRVEKGKRIENLEIDSLRDIGGNKLITINQRTDVKDFVDLYYLLKDHFTLWDLLYVVEAKFRMKLDLLMLASDFMKVEEFDFLPRMLTKLTNKELTAFFLQQAKTIGQKISK